MQKERFSLEKRAVAIFYASDEIQKSQGRKVNNSPVLDLARGWHTIDLVEKMLALRRVVLVLFGECVKFMRCH